MSFESSMQTPASSASPTTPLAKRCNLVMTERTRAGLLRKLADPHTAVCTSPRMRIDFTHNDYLSLRADSRFQEDAWLACQNLPIGSGASRLLGGEHSIFATLESKFSRFKGADSSLLFSSGYAANLALSCLYQLADIQVFSDQLNHASLIDGMRLGKLKRSQNLHIYAHNDMEQLADLLEQQQATCPLIVTESVFSMDGDTAPIRELESLAKRYHATIILDEAHALGVYGPNGSGLSLHFSESFRRHQLITVNPCGKAMAVSGALISGPDWLRTYLINHAREFIYSTAPSPWLAAGLLTSLAWMPRLEDRRRHLRDLSHRFRSHLIAQGFSIGTSTTHIIPIIIGDPEPTLAVEAKLKEQHYLAKSIRPPTVAPGSSRLRLSLSSHLNWQDLEVFTSILSEIRR